MVLFSWWSEQLIQGFITWYLKLQENSKQKLLGQKACENRVINTEVPNVSKYFWILGGVPRRRMLQKLSCFMCAEARIISTPCLWYLQDFLLFHHVFVCFIGFLSPLLLSPWLTCLSLAVLANNRSAGKSLMQEHGRSSGRWLRTPQESIFSAVTAQWQLIDCFKGELCFLVSLLDDGGFGFNGFLLLYENDGLTPSIIRK